MLNDTANGEHHINFQNELNHTHSVVVRPQIPQQQQNQQHFTRPRSKSVIHISSKYDSVDYDIWENELFAKGESDKGYSHIISLNVIRWVLYFFIGLLTSLVAIFIDICINRLFELRSNVTNYYVNAYVYKGNTTIGYMLWYSSVMIPVLIDTLIVIWIEPSAAGSGLPLVVSHLNGVRFGQLSRMRVVVIKAMSAICACTAGLTVGKEGPFVHIGSIIGHKIAFTNIPRNKFLSDNIRCLNTNEEKRDFMAGGFAAGVSAAFGSPVGATLMSLEEGTSFWSVNLMWKIFFSSIICCYTYNTIMKCFLASDGQQSCLGLFYFGKFNENVIYYEYLELPVFIAFGIVGGLFSALVITVNMKIISFRQRYLRSQSLKIFDAMVVAFLTATSAIISISFFEKCQTYQFNEYQKKSVQMACEDGAYNEVSMFWFQKQESILRLLLNNEPDVISVASLLVFGAFYSVLFMITLGVNISGGFFIPHLIIGATWGRTIGLILHQAFPHLKWAHPAKYALMGATAQLGGMVRITVSLTIIIIEATGTLTFGLPIMLILFIAKWVGDLFTDGLNASQINLLGIPILPNDPPPLTSDILAKDLMNKYVEVFPVNVSIKYLLDILKEVPYEGFPVVNQLLPQVDSTVGHYGQLDGFVLRTQLVALLSNKLFMPPQSSQEILETLRSFYKNDISLNQIQNISPPGVEEMLNLRPYMNQSPYTVSQNMSFPRVYRLFRNLGLRHVIVVNNKNEPVKLIDIQVDHTRSLKIKFQINYTSKKSGVDKKEVKPTYAASEWDL